MNSRHRVLMFPALDARLRAEQALQHLGGLADLRVVAAFHEVAIDVGHAQIAVLNLLDAQQVAFGLFVEARLER